MFTRKPSTESTDLENAIKRLHESMLSTSPDSKEYAAMADNLIKLYKLREHDTVKRYRPSPDVVLTVAANLIGIGLIIKHEDVNVITSKAMGFVQKLR